MGDRTAVSKTGADLLGNRRFESISLQRGVRNELERDIAFGALALGAGSLRHSPRICRPRPAGSWVAYSPSILLRSRRSENAAAHPMPRHRGPTTSGVCEGRDITAASRTHGPYRSLVVRGKALTVARWIGRGTFKAAALIGAFVLIIALWLWDASILTRAADQNLQLIKAATRVLPPDWASKTESALRIFGADRALLLVEGVAVAKLIMLGIAQPFRRRRP